MVIKNMRSWIVIENENGITVWRKINANYAYGTIHLLGIMNGWYNEWALGFMSNSTAYVFRKEDVKEYCIGKQRIFKYPFGKRSEYLIITDYDVAIMDEYFIMDYFKGMDIEKNGFEIDGKQALFFSPIVLEDGSIVETKYNGETIIWRASGEINAWITNDEFWPIKTGWKFSANYDFPVIEAGISPYSSKIFKETVEVNEFPVIDTKGRFVGTYRIEKEKDNPIIVKKEDIIYKVYGNVLSNPVFILGDTVFQILGKIKTEEFFDCLEKGCSKKAFPLAKKDEFFGWVTSNRIFPEGDGKIIELGTENYTNIAI